MRTKKRIFRNQDITILLETAVQQHTQTASTRAFKYWRGSSIPFVKLAADHIATHGIMLAWRPLLERLRDVPHGAGHEEALYLAQILGYDGLDVMLPGSLWVTRALQDLAGMETAYKERWILLLQHAAKRDRRA